MSGTMPFGQVMEARVTSWLKVIMDAGNCPGGAPRAAGAGRRTSGAGPSPRGRHALRLARARAGLGEAELILQEVLAGALVRAEGELDESLGGDA